MKKVKAVILIFLCISCAFTMTSCKGKVKQLKDRSLVQGVGIDKSKEGFEVTVQLFDVSKSGVSAQDLKGSITTTYSFSGKTIASAVDNGQKLMEREIFLAQNKVIVVSEEIAKTSMEQVLDYFVRAQNCRPDVQLAITKEKAKTVIEAHCKDATIPAEKIRKTIINGEYNAKSVGWTIMDAVNDYENEVSSMFLPVVKTVGKGDDSDVKLDGVAVYSQKKFAGYLNDKQTRGLLWCNAKVVTGTIVVNTEKLGNVSLVITNAGARRSVDTKDGRIVYNCDIKCNANVNEVQKGLTSSLTREDIKEIEKKADKIIRDEAEETLGVCLRQYSSDVFAIGRRLSQNNYDYYKKIKSSYYEELPFTDFHVTAKCAVKRVNNEAVKG